MFPTGYIEEFLDIPGFQTKILAKFVDTICTFFHTHSLILCVIALYINYQRSKLRYRRKINSLLRHRSS